jgi:hypothetical protein
MPWRFSTENLWGIYNLIVYCRCPASLSSCYTVHI